MGQSINRQIKRLEKHPGEFQKFNEFISSYSGEDLTDLGYDVEIQKDDFSIDDDKKYLFWFWQNRRKFLSIEQFFKDSSVCGMMKGQIQISHII